MLAEALLGVCITVEGDSISARELAAGVPELRAVDPEARFGFAPVPGMRRVVSVAQLNAFLRRHGVRTAATVLEPVCVERLVTPITEQQIVRAIEAAFVGRDVLVEVSGFANRQVPAGALSFPLHTLPRPASPGAEVVWNGWHRDAAGRATPVWARVRLSESVEALVALRAVAAGALLGPEDAALRVAAAFPAAQTRGAVPFLGKAARRPIRAGQSIDPVSDLDAPITIRKGDALEIEIRNGDMRILAAGKAETSAREGQRVTVSMADSKRVLQAIAKEKGHVVVDISNGATR